MLVVQQLFHLLGNLVDALAVSILDYELEGLKGRCVRDNRGASADAAPYQPTCEVA
jgi:hypothetical protein